MKANLFIFPIILTEVVGNVHAHSPRDPFSYITHASLITMKII